MTDTTRSAREILPHLRDFHGDPYIPEIHDDEPDPLTDAPICTETEAKAAGLDIAPSLSELTAMAETIVAAAEGTPVPEIDLARAVPLLATCIERLRAEWYKAAETTAEQAQRLATREREHNADREALEQARARVAELERRVNELVQQRDDALVDLVAEDAAGVEPDNVPDLLAEAGEQG